MLAPHRETCPFPCLPHTPSLNSMYELRCAAESVVYMIMTTIPTIVRVEPAMTAPALRKVVYQLLHVFCAPARAICMLLNHLTPSMVTARVRERCHASPRATCWHGVFNRRTVVLQPPCAKAAKRRSPYMAPPLTPPRHSSRACSVHLPLRHFELCS